MSGSKSDADTNSDCNANSDTYTDGNTDADANSDADTNPDAEPGHFACASGFWAKDWIPELRSAGNVDKRDVQQSGTISEDR